MKKKIFIILLVSIMVLLSSCGEKETEPESVWPENPIEVIVPYNPGSDADTFANGLITYLSEDLGVDITITTMTGSSGTVASNYIRNDASSSGYKVLFWNTAILTNSIYGLSDYSYEAFTDACTVIEDSSYYIFASPKFGSLKALTEFAKKNPGAVTIGCTTDSFNRLCTQIVLSVLDIEVTPVDFPSYEDAADGIASGKVDFFIGSSEQVKDHISASYIVPVACIGEKSTALPDVETLMELGYDKIRVKQIYGFFFPKETDRRVVDLFNKSISKCANYDEFRNFCRSHGADVSINYLMEAENIWKSELDYYRVFLK
ncbi:MAG: hypothetical protein MJ171_01925 [Clostridia bacterium]|nr:hypothetical protein [Clostridia bacterium]